MYSDLNESILLPVEVSKQTAGRVVNSVDPDEMLRSAASDQGLHVCSDMSVPIHRVNAEITALGYVWVVDCLLLLN